MNVERDFLTDMARQAAARALENVRLAAAHPDVGVELLDRVCAHDWLNDEELAGILSAPLWPKAKSSFKKATATGVLGWLAEKGLLEKSWSELERPGTFVNTLLLGLSGRNFINRIHGMERVLQKYDADQGALELEDYNSLIESFRESGAMTATLIMLDFQKQRLRADNGNAIEDIPVPNILDGYCQAQYGRHYTQVLMRTFGTAETMQIVNTLWPHLRNYAEGRWSGPGMRGRAVIAPGNGLLH